MEIFSTSHDLVNLALVIGIIALSAAMVYFFITAAGFIREMRKTIDEFNRQLAVVSQITDSIKSKLSFMFSYWSVLGKLVDKTINLFQNMIFKKAKNKISHFSSAKKHEPGEEDAERNDLDSHIEIKVEPKSKVKSKAKAKAKKSKIKKDI